MFGWHVQPRLLRPTPSGKNTCEAFRFFDSCFRKIMALPVARERRLAWCAKLPRFLASNSSTVSPRNGLTTGSFGIAEPEPKRARGETACSKPRLGWASKAPSMTQDQVRKGVEMVFV